MTTVKPNSTTELLFSEFLTNENNSMLKQISEYKRVADIYERTQFALGRRVSFKSTNCSTEKVIINMHGIKGTNQI